MHFTTSYTALAAVLSFAASIQAASLNAEGPSLWDRAVATRCRGAGQYPLAINGRCQPCSVKFAGAATCSTTAATRCSKGLLSAGRCVTACPSGEYNSNGSCASCAKQFRGSATCNASGATKCQTGYLASGKCDTNCPTGFVNSPSTRTCVACNRFDAQATTCTNGKISACANGSYLDTKKNDCIQCTTVDKNAVTCSGPGAVLTCRAPYAKSRDGKSCVLGTSYSYYLSSAVPDVPYFSNVNSAITCARNAAAKGMQVVAYDESSQTCFAQGDKSDADVRSLVWDSDTNVILYGDCKTNNALNPDAKNRCRDVTLTASACTLSDKKSCDSLLSACLGSQFRNAQGVCQQCDSAFADSTTCDINGAKTCEDGNFLTADKTCSTCTAFDENAAACNAGGTVLDCNNGWVLADGKCVVDTTPGPDVLEQSWSYYVDSIVATNTTGAAGKSDMFDCAEGAYESTLTLAAFDVASSLCYSLNATEALQSTITESAGNAVFLIGTCDANSAQVGEAVTGRCYDVVIDAESCTNEDGAACS